MDLRWTKNSVLEPNRVSMLHVARTLVRHGFRVPGAIAAAHVVMEYRPDN